METTRSSGTRVRTTLAVVAAFALSWVIGLLTALPAQAAAPAQVGWISAADAEANGLPVATIVIDARATGGELTVGWNTQYNTPSLLFQDGVGSAGPGFASVPDGCAAFTAGLYCPLDAVVVYFGSGNDFLVQSGICMTALVADLGNGSNKFYGHDGCPNEQYAVSGGSGPDELALWNNPAAGAYLDAGGGDDIVIGSAGTDEIHGGAGNDEIRALMGADVILGDDGDDVIFGGPGADTQKGGGGNDTFRSIPGGQYGGGEVDTGADDLSGGPGRDTVDQSLEVSGVVISLDDKPNDSAGGSGDNVRSDIERVLGSGGNDRLVGSGGADELNGGYGVDTILGGGGNDYLSGGADGDRIDGGGGKDSVYGDTSSCCLNNGNDTITVRDGTRDAVNCGGGGDVVKADRADIVAQDGQQRCERVSRGK